MKNKTNHKASEFRTLPHWEAVNRRVKQFAKETKQYKRATDNPDWRDSEYDVVYHVSQTEEK